MLQTFLFVFFMVLQSHVAQRDRKSLTDP